MPIYNKAALLLVCPNEPAFMVKGKYQFDLSVRHLATRYRQIGSQILEYCNNKEVEKIPVKTLETYPDLTYLKTLPKSAEFSTFNANHQKFASELIQILNAATDLDELISIALYCRDEINVQLFIYAYYLVVSHRFVNIVLPNAFEIIPQCFVKKAIFEQLKEACHAQENKKAKPIVVKFRTGNVTNPEERLNFFREDIGLNSHHFHWHVIYPQFGDLRDFLDKDRRGELFYYMHHQMVIIYHFNRLTARVAPVVPLTNFRGTIKEGYYPNMTTLTSSQNFPPRQENTKLMDGKPERAHVDNLTRWFDRLHEVADQEYCLDSHGNKVNLISDKGFDDFVNLLEANPLSKNFKFYGDFHGSGHGLIAHIHDPTGKYKQPAAVMGYNQTAVRDPMFFQWHQMIDNLCMKVKDKLPPYTKTQLAFDGIKMISIDLLDADNKPFPKNQLITYWQQSDINLANGLDFQSHRSAYVRFTHLNNQSFTYSMKIENTNASAVQGTIRIFLIPILDEKNEFYDYENARKRAFELDRFMVLFPPGLVRVIRKDIDSSMTIRQDRTYPNEKDDAPFSLDQPSSVQAECMCGWPQNLLLPKGNENGYPFYLYVMISDYSGDRIDQAPSNGACNDNYVLCGLRNRKYPDKRAMGFPFDRPLSEKATNLIEFVSKCDNMMAKPITIRHLSENTAQIGDNPLDITDL